MSGYGTKEAVIVLLIAIAIGAIFSPFAGIDSFANDLWGL